MKNKKVLSLSMLIILGFIVEGIIFYNVGLNKSLSKDVLNANLVKDKEYNKIQSEIDERKKILTGLESEIAIKTSELNEVNNKIIQSKNEIKDIENETNNEPILLSPGEYIVGESIKAGVYDIEWVEGFGMVSGKNGFSMSQTFGDKGSSIKEYKNATLKEGSKIEISGTLKINLVNK